MCYFGQNNVIVPKATDADNVLCNPQIYHSKKRLLQSCKRHFKREIEDKTEKVPRDVPMAKF